MNLGMKLVSGLLVALATAQVFAGADTTCSGQSSATPWKRIVLLKFKAGTTPEMIDELVKGILALQPKIPAIASLAVHANTSDPEVSRGCTHVVFVTFRTAEDRAAFLADPTHKKYETEVLVPSLQDFLVIEFTQPLVP